jgi:hypothetical protein
MSQAETKIPLEVTVGDQSFRIRIAPSEGERCRRSERAANESLRQVQAGAGALTGSRALAMALFQLAVELEEARDAQRLAQESRDRLRLLIAKIDQATANQAANLSENDDDSDSEGRG